MKIKKKYIIKYNDNIIRIFRNKESVYNYVCFNYSNLDECTKYYINKQLTNDGLFLSNNKKLRITVVFINYKCHLCNKFINNVTQKRKHEKSKLHQAYMKLKKCKVKEKRKLIKSINELKIKNMSLIVCFD